MRVIDENYLGLMKSEWEKDNNGKSYLVHYNKIEVTKQCKYCGYKTREDVVRKG